jgi:hypothetical protein
MLRCEAVIRELAAPTPTRDCAALADHLKNCPSCQAWAQRASQLDRLWETTRPAEPAPEAWVGLWSQIAQSLDQAPSQEYSSRVPLAWKNGAASQPVVAFESKLLETPAPPARSSRSRLWTAIAIVGVAQAAAVLLIAGLNSSSFVRPKQKIAALSPRNPTAATPDSAASSLPVVDIEEGHVVVILADPTRLTVTDLTPKGMTAVADRGYLDWYGDERYFAWQQVFNELEFLAKPTVAMKD